MWEHWGWVKFFFSPHFFSISSQVTSSPLSFQFFLSLYGHKLPVLCMDIAFVSKMEAVYRSPGESLERFMV